MNSHAAASKRSAVVPPLAMHRHERSRIIGPRSSNRAGRTARSPAVMHTPLTTGRGTWRPLISVMRVLWLRRHASESVKRCFCSWNQDSSDCTISADVPLSSLYPPTCGARASRCAWRSGFKVLELEVKVLKG